MFYEDVSAEAGMINKLTTEYSAETICAFLQDIGLIQSKAALDIIAFDRMIYVLGNKDEIYGKDERSIIAGLSQQVFFSESTKESFHSAITCRILVFDLRNSVNCLFDSVAIVKLVTKACEGFNLLVFVESNGIRFGCANIDHISIEPDVIISPLVSPNENCPLFFDCLTSVYSGNDFKLYYRSIISALISMQSIINDEKKDVDERADFYYSDSYYSYCYDDDEWKDERIDESFDGRIDKIINIYDPQSSIVNEPEYSNDTRAYAEFMDELSYYSELLSFIKSKRVNSLELLFDSQKEKNEENDTDSKGRVGIIINDTLDSDPMQLDDFVDDPIELLKRIKMKERSESNENNR